MDRSCSRYQIYSELYILLGGIQLGQATVNTGMPNQQQGANGGQQQARSSSGAGGAGQEQDGEIAATATTTSGLGLVDTFA